MKQLGDVAALLHLRQRNMRDTVALSPCAQLVSLVFRFVFNVAILRDVLWCFITLLLAFPQRDQGC